MKEGPCDERVPHVARYEAWSVAGISRAEKIRSGGRGGRRGRKSLGAFPTKGAARVPRGGSKGKKVRSESPWRERSRRWRTKPPEDSGSVSVCIASMSEMRTPVRQSGGRIPCCVFCFPCPDGPVAGEATSMRKTLPPPKDTATVTGSTASLHVPGCPSVIRYMQLGRYG